MHIWVRNYPKKSLRFSTVRKFQESFWRGNVVENKLLWDFKVGEYHFWCGRSACTNASIFCGSLWPCVSTPLETSTANGRDALTAAPTFSEWSPPASTTPTNHPKSIANTRKTCQHIHELVCACVEGLTECIAYTSRNTPIKSTAGTASCLCIGGVKKNAQKRWTHVRGRLLQQLLGGGVRIHVQCFPHWQGQCSCDTWLL